MEGSGRACTSCSAQVVPGSQSVQPGSGWLFGRLYKVVTELVGTYPDKRHGIAHLNAVDTHDYEFFISSAVDLSELAPQLARLRE